MMVAGIGYHTAVDLATRNARVILACRDRVKAEAAKAAIVDATGNPHIVVKCVDMSSLMSVRALAEEINREEDQLNVLINNAGVTGEIVLNF